MREVRCSKVVVSEVCAREALRRRSWGVSPFGIHPVAARKSSSGISGGQRRGKGVVLLPTGGLGGGYG